MANTLDAAIPKILAAGLVNLRQATTLPSLISRDFDDEAAQKGDTITIHDAEDISARDVSPSNTPPANVDNDQKKATIALDKWKEAPFYLTDKELAEVVDGAIPQRIEKASKALAEQINTDIFDTYKKVWNSVGTAGTTPFGSDYTEASAARKALNNESVPMSDRRMVIDPDAEENAINLSSFADASFTDDDSVIVDGQIGRKLGFDWAMDQQVPTHTAGSITGDPTVNGSHSEGATSISITTDTDDETDIKEGDLISFGGDSQTYAAQSALSLGNSASGSVDIEPSLQVALSGGEALSHEESTDHVVNLSFHRDAFALAVRPLADVTDPRVTTVETMIDPLTGIPLRLEITRQHKQTQFSFDVLYGTECIQPELAARVKG